MKRTGKIPFTQKNKITISGLNYNCQSLGVKTTVRMRGQFFNVFHLCNVINLGDEKVHKNLNLGRQNDLCI